MFYLFTGFLFGCECPHTIFVCVLCVFVCYVCVFVCMLVYVCEFLLNGLCVSVC